MKPSTAFVVAVTLMVGTGGLSANTLELQGRGRGQAKEDRPAERQKPAQKADKQGKSDDKGRDPVFDRDRHARTIRDYRAAGSLPPGLAKRESLPPGLRKQLRERGELPPGLQKHLVDVPEPLGARLPPVPGHYRRYFAGDDLIVVDTRSNTVVAIVPDVLR